MKKLLLICLFLYLTDGKPKSHDPYEHPLPLGTADRGVRV
jgi:hypothetical protein